MRLSILAAMAENRTIGRDGELPWRLPAELKRVKELTTGHCLLMGRKTYDSIGRPLPNRTSIVVSRDPGFHPNEVTVVSSFEAAIDAAVERGDDEAFVFGGAQIYSLALPLADRLYLTRVHAEIDGDVCFPNFDGDEWKLVEEEHHPADDRHLHAFTFEIYDRRR
jgi:dihydrofolate reductase